MTRPDMSRSGRCCPALADSLVLITSRRRLAALEEATPISLGTLPPGEAAALFARLVGRRDSDADAGRGDHPPVRVPAAGDPAGRRTLRHHPAWTITDLATELAAARDRLAAMRAENLSVAAAFDLSYQDLTADQQRLFRRLGLHPGTNIDALRRRGPRRHQPGRRPPRHLDDLYDQHLITEPARGRYRLHDLLHEHARGLAPPTTPPPARPRSAGCWTTTCTPRWPPVSTFRLERHRGQPRRPAAAPACAPPVSTFRQAAAWLEDERANLHAAAGYAAAAGFPGTPSPSRPRWKASWTPAATGIRHSACCRWPWTPRIRPGTGRARPGPLRC